MTRIEAEQKALVMSRDDRQHNYIAVPIYMGPMEGFNPAVQVGWEVKAIPIHRRRPIIRSRD